LHFISVDIIDQATKQLQLIPERCAVYSVLAVTSVIVKCYAYAQVFLAIHFCIRNRNQVYQVYKQFVQEIYVRGVVLL